MNSDPPTLPVFSSHVTCELQLASALCYLGESPLKNKRALLESSSDEIREIEAMLGRHFLASLPDLPPEPQFK